MKMNEARQIAARAWCHSANTAKAMDVDLAESFAFILAREVHVRTAALEEENRRLREQLESQSAVWPAIWLYRLGDPASLEEAKKAAVAYASKNHIFLPVIEAEFTGISKDDGLPNPHSDLPHMTLPLPPFPVKPPNDAVAEATKLLWQALEEQAQGWISAGYNIAELERFASPEGEWICPKDWQARGIVPKPIKVEVVPPRGELLSKAVFCSASSKRGYTLCEKTTKGRVVTIIDRQVTCPECLKVMAAQSSSPVNQCSVPGCPNESADNGLGKCAECYRKFKAEFDATTPAPEEADPPAEEKWTPGRKWL